MKMYLKYLFERSWCSDYFCSEEKTCNEVKKQPFNGFLLPTDENHYHDEDNGFAGTDDDIDDIEDGQCEHDGIMVITTIIMMIMNIMIIVVISIIMTVIIIMVWIPFLDAQASLAPTHVRP